VAFACAEIYIDHHSRSLELPFLLHCPQTPPGNNVLLHSTCMSTHLTLLSGEVVVSVCVSLHVPSEILKDSVVVVASRTHTKNSSSYECILR